jgi:hypothetical protein
MKIGSRHSARELKTEKYPFAMPNTNSSVRWQTDSARTSREHEAGAVLRESHLFGGKTARESLPLSHASVKRRSRFGEITGHDHAKYAPDRIYSVM